MRDPIGTPLLPFSFNLWLGVIVCFFVGIIVYKILRIVQVKIEGRENVDSENVPLITLNILGIFVLQSVKLE